MCAFIRDSCSDRYPRRMEHTARKFILGTVLKPRALPALIAFVISSSSSLAIAAQNDAGQCRPTGPVVQIPGLSEASGLAASSRVPGRLWTHNDSGEPVGVSVDARGTVTGRVRLMGARVEDWEAIAVGPCGTGSCLHVGDIGDNEAKRKRITIYRLPEPDGTNGSATVADVRSSSPFPRRLSRRRVYVPFRFVRVV